MKSHLKRTFIPGDKWVYIKLYTGYKTADSILSDIFLQIIKKKPFQGCVDKWFFIRYSDPYHHLRLRFCLKNKNSFLKIVSMINKAISPYVSKNIIWKVQLETYQREMERYGKMTMIDAENIFHFDSMTIINIIKKLGINDDENRRWLLALKLIDQFLEDFSFSLNQKFKLLASLSEIFKKEFGFTDRDMQIQLDKKFRENRTNVEEILMSPDKTHWIIPYLDFINQKSDKVKPIAKKLIKLDSKQMLENPLENLLSSYIHMTINRLFRSNHRLTEMVLYDILQRFYSSLIARNKYNINTEKQF